MNQMVPQARLALARLSDAGLLRTQLFVGGAFVDTDFDIAVTDPATGLEIARVAACDEPMLERAISYAGNAFGGWRDMLAADRGRILSAWGRLVRENVADLAVILSAEQGKPLAEARAEILYGAGFMDWFAAEGERAYGETIPSHKPGSRLFVSLQPVGIAAAVTPWNFPSAMIARKASAALAAGCAVIVKPAVETPLSALALAVLAERAGFPPGVFQVVTGEPERLVGRLLDDQRVRAFSFTGSTEIGRMLLSRAGKTVKKVSMELGGHAPFIVFDDADFDLAVEGCMAAKFTTSGQDCLAANRIFVQDRLYDRFIERLAQRISALRSGSGFEAGVDIGPMTKRSVVEKCRTHIHDALKRGARLVAGAAPEPGAGNFVAPTLLGDVDDQMLIAREETFGPVAPVLRFSSEEEIRARANATEMGLAAYVYTTHVNRAMRLSDRLEFGMVGVNTPSFTGAPIPFGGWKQSGLGREGSRHGLQDFSELKYVCFGSLAA